MSESFDAFLGGKVNIFQPKDGFRAGTDTVLLAASVPAKPNERILELGAGSGAGLVCLGARVSSLHLMGIELLAENADRANRNLRHADLRGEVATANVFENAHPFLKEQYDRVFINPPFYADGAHSHPSQETKAHAHIAKYSIQEWIKAGLKRVRAQGTLNVILPSECLADILSAVPSATNAIIIQPIATIANQPAKRVIVQITVQRKSALVLNAPLNLQDENGKKTEALLVITRDGQDLRL